jgi:hypothetical protein
MGMKAYFRMDSVVQGLTKIHNRFKSHCYRGMYRGLVHHGSKFIKKIRIIELGLVVLRCGCEPYRHNHVR